VARCVPEAYYPLGITQEFGDERMFQGHADEVSKTHATGWAADTDRPDQFIDVVIYVDGQRHARIACDELRQDLKGHVGLGGAPHGFRFAFEPALPADLPQRVSIRFVDTGEVLPGGERILPALRPKHELRPLLVTAPGRSGTTFVMTRLMASRAITVAEVVPFEVRLLSYYATAYRILTNEGDLKSTHPDMLEGDGYFVGFNPFNSPEYHQAFQTRGFPLDLFERYGPGEILDAFRKIIIEYYTRLAHDQSKDAARYFAEKTNNLDRNTRIFARRAFPGLHEIVLLRDPRDLVCSHMSYFKSSLEKAFADIRDACSTLIRIADEADESTMIVKYEDLLLGNPNTYDAISAFLHTPVSLKGNETLEQAIFQQHATSPSKAGSVGRSLRDLDHATRAKCNELMRDFCERFSYDLD
jgi:hypothetical protein